MIVVIIGSAIIVATFLVLQFWFNHWLRFVITSQLINVLKLKINQNKVNMEGDRYNVVA